MAHPRIQVRTDRDSVAMGDDMVSHTRELALPAGIPLQTLLEESAPEIRSPGWSWVAVADRESVAVWSADHGVRLLVENRDVQAGPVDVHFRYFRQIDPAWLHRRLAEGAPPDLEALTQEYAPIAQERRERELRRREEATAERYLSRSCVDALTRLGATIELHADTECRILHRDVRWTLRRADTMTSIFRGRLPIASLRPRTLAEEWIVAAIGAEQRLARGLPPIPQHEPHPVPELRPMHALPGEPPRWGVTGPLTAQLAGEDAVALFRFAVGRSVDEIAAAMSADRV